MHGGPRGHQGSGAYIGKRHSTKSDWSFTASLKRLASLVGRTAAAAAAAAPAGSSWRITRERHFSVRRLSNGGNGMFHRLTFAISWLTGIMETRSGLVISSSPSARWVALWLPWWPTL